LFLFAVLWRNKKMYILLELVYVILTQFRCPYYLSWYMSYLPYSTNALLCLIYPAAPIIIWYSMYYMPSPYAPITRAAMLFYVLLTLPPCCSMPYLPCHHAVQCLTYPATMLFYALLRIPPCCSMHYLPCPNAIVCLLYALQPRCCSRVVSPWACTVVSLLPLSCCCATTSVYPSSVWSSTDHLRHHSVPTQRTMTRVIQRHARHFTIFHARIRPMSQELAFLQIESVIKWVL